MNRIIVMIIGCLLSLIVDNTMVIILFFGITFMLIMGELSRITTNKIKELYK